jgi:phosphocarrier protein HPr
MPESSEAAITLAGDLHARPAGSLALAAAGFASAVQLAIGATSVDAKSVLSVMGLGATTGQQVVVRATGPDACEAVAAMIGILAQATPVGG